MTRVLGTGGAVSGLAALGVKKGAAVSIDWTVELATPVLAHYPATNSTEYRATGSTDGITSFAIEIGGWTATGADPAQGIVDLNRILVGGGTSANPEQTIALSRSANDTNSLVTNNDPNESLIVLNLSAPNGGVSASNALLDLKPSLYLSSAGAVVGHSGNEVDFAIPGVVADTTAKCRASQLASAGALCQGSLKCRAAYAKAPSKDPYGAKLDTCLANTRAKFVAAFDKAATAATKKGLSCATSETGATFAADFDTAEADVAAVVASVQPQNPPVISAWYSGAGAMCSAAAKAESKNVTSPSSKVVLVREAARVKLTAAASAAVAKAEKKGIVFDPPPDVAGLVESIDKLIDDVVSEIDGP
ncbi:MAG: hypothetical protein ACHQ6T_08290 [Myxococcota bacterium]